ncbi:ribonuclease H family protein [Rhizobium skierniewicense]|uniref:ribonuclease H family protein n=1 Tax=Rhizobium skierniewicense TaxID=984260 RepID=UPI001FAC4FDF|nr:ribonuclease H [Rhizobium skierniewicense]
MNQLANPAISGPFHIYVDGSYDPALKRGGWAFAVVDGDTVIETRSGRCDVTSNNTIELLAALQASEWAVAEAAAQQVIIWTDSRHVFEGCDRWRHIWKNNGWKRYSPNPKSRNRALVDAPLWQRLSDCLETHQSLRVEWCKGHDGNAGNERADALANAARDAGA